MTNILRIDASARTEGSASRELASRLVDRIAEADGSAVADDCGPGAAGSAARRDAR